MFVLTLSNTQINFESLEYKIQIVLKESGVVYKVSFHHLSKILAMFVLYGVR